MNKVVYFSNSFPEEIGEISLTH